MSQAKRPNVLLLVADQWRGDCLGIAGHPEVKTPYLDALAIQGAGSAGHTARCPAVSRRAPPCSLACGPNTTAGWGMRTGFDGITPTHWPDVLPGRATRPSAWAKCMVHPLRSRQGFEAVELHDGYLHFNRSSPDSSGVSSAHRG